jgi:hypothetical protein
MDYDEYWKKWLSLSVEIIVKNNIIKSRQGGDIISVGNVGQAQVLVSEARDLEGSLLS